MSKSLKCESIQRIIKNYNYFTIAKTRIKSNSANVPSLLCSLKFCIRIRIK